MAFFFFVLSSGQQASWIKMDLLWGTLFLFSCSIKKTAGEIYDANYLHKLSCIFFSKLSVAGLQICASVFLDRYVQQFANFNCRILRKIRDFHSKHSHNWVARVSFHSATSDFRAPRGRFYDTSLLLFSIALSCYRIDKCLHVFNYM